MTWLGYSHKGIAKRLSLTTQPGGAVAGAVLTTQPVVQLVDGASLPASQSSVAVTVVKHSGVVGTLSGTSPVATAANGRAAFTDLAMSAAETGVTWDFSASGLTSVTSVAFDVSAPPSGALQVSGRVLTLNGVPFAGIGDTAWSAMVQLTTTDMDQYLNDRASRGFRAVIVSLVEHFYGTNAPNTIDNIHPWTGDVPFSTFTAGYLTRTKYFLTKAASLGIQVWLTPAYMGFGGGGEGWWSEMQAAGASALAAYGTYLANQYGSYDNIVWVHGGDFVPTLNGTNLGLIRAIPNAIRAVTTKWRHTYHTARSNSAVTALGTGEAWLDVDSIYTTIADVSSLAATSYGRSPVYPFFHIEGIYENEGTGEAGCRQQAWQAVMGGGFGAFLGNSPIWKFDTGWQSALSSAASTHFTALAALLDAYPTWNASAPANSMVTSGSALVRRHTSGTFALLYLPSGGTITVNMTQLSPTSVRARWFDPTSGTYTTVSGSPFPNTGTHNFTAPANGTSTGDMVLVLDDAGFVTPDILNNASFETGFDGFLDGGASTPSGVTRSTDFAFSGSFSLKRAWTSGGELESQCFYNIGSRTHFFSRCYYKVSVLPNGTGFKVFRYQDGGFNHANGMQVLNGFWVWVGASDESAIAYTNTQPVADNAWHYIEFEWDRTNQIIRMWQDGVAMGQGSSTDAGLSWSGNDLHYTTAITPTQLDILRIINARTNSGAIYIDRVAVSTQRIGP